MSADGWKGPGFCPELIGDLVCNAEAVQIPGEDPGFCRMHFAEKIEAKLAEKVFTGEVVIVGTNEFGRTMYRVAD